MHTFTILPVRGLSKAPAGDRSTFREDVIHGLTETPKRLESKYFYDAMGDRLFQDIMQLPEYYLTGCELEILSGQTREMIHAIKAHTGDFDLVELGAGDATKTRFLLQELLDEGVDFTYFPIDISSNVIQSLEEYLPAELPALRYKGLNGEYFDMLQAAGALSRRHKVVLLMGANIGNFHPAEALQFCQAIREQLQPGDLLLIGFDLKKDPRVILDAYNDSRGVTRAFNLNLLTRMNRELGADFDLNDFEHFPTYDPLSGSCKSYLFSKRAHHVHIGKTVIDFGENEPVYMEISQKYSLEGADQMALSAGFKPLLAFQDSKGWFADCLWAVV
jgi:dimethylhistidine N-methyltransferase